VAAEASLEVHRVQVDVAVDLDLVDGERVLAVLERAVVGVVDLHLPLRINR